MKDVSAAAVREATEEDLPAVRELIHQVIDKCYTDYYPPHAIRFYKQHHSDDSIRMRQREGAVLLIEHEGKPVATGSIVGNSISAVFVHPDLQNQGYGETIMHELERRASESGFGETVLDISLPARGFYEKMGYVILEARSINFGEGQALEYWKARKSLGGGGSSV